MSSRKGNHEIMKSIYASKLYRASKRKDRIKAALLAEGNFELVKQLTDSLGEEYKTPENLGVEKGQPKQDKPEGTSEFDDFIVDEEIDPENDLVKIDDIDVNKPTRPHKSAPSKPASNPDSSKSDVKPDKPDTKSEADTSDLMPDSPATDVNTEPKEDAAASTKIKASELSNLNILKTSLNDRADTAGVTRIAEKENEIWIYYNDDVNLNNIMTDVIEYIMNSGYEEFEFNRLARSDNAIVFLNEVSTSDELDSVEDTVVDAEKVEVEGFTACE